MRSILVLDDEPLVLETITDFLARNGFEVQGCSRAHDALESLKRSPWGLLITDLDLPDLDGLSVLDRARQIRPDCEVLMITGHGTIATAVEALKRGAVDFLTKPFDLRKRLLPVVEQILAGPEPVLPIAAVRPETQRPGEVQLIAESEAMRALVDKLPRIARAGSSVLLHGESGTGKEVVADAIHRLSPRCQRPLVKVNCAAIPEALFESELFGHRKGSFTGADRDREGLVERAEQGTLFLDEIGELPPAMQAKLLRVLQDGQFRRVGESDSRRADFRLIAATNRDLGRLNAAGHLRADLYYRIAVIQVELPPLRERPEDVEPLARAFVRACAPNAEVSLSDASWRALRGYVWPGNVRELRNAIEHALVLSDGAEVGVEHLPIAIQDFVAASGAERAAPSSLEQIEVDSILRALERTRGNQTEAAGLLGITRRTLGYRIRKFNLQPEIAARLAPRAPLKVESASSSPQRTGGFRRI